MIAVRRLLVPTAVATVALAGALVQPAPASAADDFGQHVAACAKDMGFNGGHNPGMHRGSAGWDPDHQC